MSKFKEILEIVYLIGGNGTATFEECYSVAKASLAEEVGRLKKVSDEAFKYISEPDLYTHGYNQAIERVLKMMRGE